MSRGRIAGVKSSPRIAILLLGGSASRFGGNTPKQLLPVEGKALFLYPFEKLNSSEEIDEIVLVVRDDIENRVREETSIEPLSKPIHYVHGGASRSESVAKAIAFLKEKGTPDEAIILIQDADRPHLSESLIREGIEKAEKYGASVTAIPCSDSVFVSADGEMVASYQARAATFLAQTPQTFRLFLLKKLTFAEISTDEASQVRALGEKVAIVKGSPNNYKINYPEDLERFKKEAEK